MLELTLKRSLEQPVDGSRLSPNLIGTMPLTDLLALPMPSPGNDSIRLDDLFWVRCLSGPSDLVMLQGDCRQIHGLATQMSGGTLVIDGHAGDRLGTGMYGGFVLAGGDAGDEVAMGMRGGLLAVSQNAGDRLGAPMPGERSGIRGGDILVGGSVGSRACERMRRGTVCVGGRIDDYLAAHMNAGTVLALGPVAGQWGVGMRRGTLLFAEEPTGPTHASWSSSRSLELSFLPLIWNHLRSIQEQLESISSLVNRSLWKMLPIPSTRWVERRIGDMNFDGRGEVLMLQRLSSTSSAAISRDQDSESPSSHT
jgi:formylmethanofuran dehydrogenase subunit C